MNAKWFWNSLGSCLSGVFRLFCLYYSIPGRAATVYKFLSSTQRLHSPGTHFQFEDSMSFYEEQLSLNTLSNFLENLLNFLCTETKTRKASAQRPSPLHRTSAES